MFATESQTKIEDQPPTLAEIVREETDNGREIIRFLLDVMRNRFEDVKMCHRVQAAVQLAKLGSKEAEAFLKAASRSKNGRAPSRAPAQSRQNDELADIIKSETSDGRDAVRFLVDVMHGNLNDFKPCHRLAAAKELLRRGFDHTPGRTNNEYEDHDESFDDDPGSPNYVDPNANRYNNEDDPFDFDNYDEEQFIRDRDGERALRHIYGSEEAVTIAHEAVARHRQQALFDENYVPDRDFTPIENPEHDLSGKGHYGYNALRFAFSDNQSVRVANRTVEEFKKRMAEYDGPNDRPSCCYPGWSRDYALAAVRKSFECPDRVEPQPDQPPENSDHAGPEPHQSSKAPDPPLSVILERSEEPPAPTPPPRQPTPNTYPGSPADDPPADGPRERRDPGDIRIPLRNLLSVSASPL